MPWGTRIATGALLLALAAGSVRGQQAPPAAAGSALPTAPSSVLADNTAKGAPQPLPALPSAAAIQPAQPGQVYQPLSSHQKFLIFVHSTYDPTTFASAALDAGIGQGTGEHPDYGQGADGFGKRYGAALASSESGVFFTRFLLPTLLHQDPRYFQLGTGSFKTRASYAVSRAFVTRTDSGGKAFNTSHVLGVALSIALSNAYVPESERGFDRTFIRIGNALASDAALNILREYWPEVLRKAARNRVTARIAPRVYP
jgi:hypothetical protein